jgi:hypothetical protein
VFGARVGIGDRTRVVLALHPERGFVHTQDLAAGAFGHRDECLHQFGAPAHRFARSVHAAIIDRR